MPWFIAIYGLSYSKSLKLDVVKQVIMATATKLGLLECCETAAKEYPVGLTDAAKKVKLAAGIYVYIVLFEFL